MLWKARWEEMFYLMVHCLNGCNSQGWARLGIALQACAVWSVVSCMVRECISVAAKLELWGFVMVSVATTTVAVLGSLFWSVPLSFGFQPLPKGCICPPSRTYSSVFRMLLLYLLSSSGAGTRSFLLTITSLASSQKSRTYSNDDGGSQTCWAAPGLLPRGRH